MSSFKLFIAGLLVSCMAVKLHAIDVIVDNKTEREISIEFCTEKNKRAVVSAAPNSIEKSKRVRGSFLKQFRIYSHVYADIMVFPFL